MRRAATLLVALALASAAQTAGAATSTTETTAGAVSDPNALRVPTRDDVPPTGYRLTARRVGAIADGIPKIRKERAEHRRTTRSVFTKGFRRWQVSYYSGDDEIGQVKVDDLTGGVLEAWTGPQVAWSMARGYPGAFGRKSNALYIWLPLCVLFLAPFVDVRRPLRLLHLDLLVLLGFSVSLAYFNDGNIDASVPLAYPFLGYLLVRMLLLGFGIGRPRAPAKVLVPIGWLAVAIIFLLGFRIGLNITNSNVIDVGYAGVIGADRLVDGDPLYGGWPDDNQHGDTYGPVNYLAYVPFEQAISWSGGWDDLPAAHATAIAFDVLTVVALWLLGRRLGGARLGILLAYAWVAFPFTLFSLSTNANDSLVALLAVLALLGVSSPPARGAVAALAGLTKFAPLALAPMLATFGRDGRARLRPRALVLFGGAFAAVAALALLPVLVDESLSTFYERTIEYQRERGSPFSVYGLYGGLDALQSAVQIAAIVLAFVLAFVPRRRDAPVLAALAAAVLIALQLGVTHWFYLYIVWFFPLVCVALLTPAREPAAA